MDKLNGRIARAITEMALSQDEKLTTRYYSFSSQIFEDRAGYYQILENCSKQDTMDLTDWILWFLDSYQKAIKRSEKILEKVLTKAEFWEKNSQAVLNEHQKKALNKMLDAGIGNFEGGLTNRKYVSMTKTNRTAAFRDITDMLSKNILRPMPGKGRSVAYEIIWP